MEGRTHQTWNIRKPRLWPGAHSANVRNSCFPWRQSSLCRTEHPPWTPGAATLPRLPGSRQFRDAQPQGPSPRFHHTLPLPRPQFCPVPSCALSSWLLGRFSFGNPPLSALCAAQLMSPWGPTTSGNKRGPSRSSP